MKLAKPLADIDRKFYFTMQFYGDMSLSTVGYKKWRMLPHYMVEWFFFFLQVTETFKVCDKIHMFVYWLQSVIFLFTFLNKLFDKRLWKEQIRLNILDIIYFNFNVKIQCAINV